MKNSFFIFLSCLCLWSMQVSAQYDYSVEFTAEQITERLQGEGVTVLNPNVRCVNLSHGLYEGTGELGIDTGLIISISDVNKIFSTYSESLSERPNLYYPYTYVLDSTMGKKYFNPMLYSWGRSSEVLLNGYISCAIEMDIVSDRNHIRFNYVMGDTHLDSIPLMWDQYWITSSLCNCFINTNIIGIFISGGDYVDTVNYAVYAQEEDVRTGVPVNRYSLRLTQDMFDEMCSSSDTDTMLWGGIPRSDYIRYNTDGYRISGVNFPGFTQVMDVNIPVTPCDTHHLVLGIHRGVGGILNPETEYIHCQLAQASGSAMFIGKISSSGEDSCTTLGLNNTPMQIMGVEMFPNPFSNNITFTSKQPHKHYRIQIVDVMGRTLYTIDGHTEHIQRTLNEDIINLLPPNQIYFCIITDMESGEKVSIKLRKE